MCTFLAYKGPEVDRPGLVTCANEHFFPKSLGNLAYSTSDKAFFCYLITNQSPVVTRQTRTAVYCMQIPGKMEGGCSISVKWNIHWDPRKVFCILLLRSQDKKNLPAAFLVSLILRAGHRKGIFSDCKSSSCFIWAGVKKSTLFCLGDLTVLDQGEQLLHSSSNGLWSRKKRQHRPVISWYFSLNSCPLISDV